MLQTPNIWNWKSIHNELIKVYVKKVYKPFIFISIDNLPRWDLLKKDKDPQDSSRLSSFLRHLARDFSIFFIGVIMSSASGKLK